MIIGKLIPAGTGMKRYRNVHLSTDVELNDTLDFDDELMLSEELPEDEIADVEDADVEEQVDEVEAEAEAETTEE